jgi:hypothetical protein
MLVGFPLTGGAQDEPDEQAKVAVHQFMKSFRTKDIDGLMSSVDVPWFHKGEKIVRDRDEVRHSFQALFAKKDDLDSIRYEIKTVIAYEAVREAMNDDERKLIDQVLNKTDRVILLQIDKPKNKEIVVLLVSFKDGAAKVVGLKT